MTSADLQNLGHEVPRLPLPTFISRLLSTLACAPDVRALQPSDRARSHPFDRFEPSGTDRLHERLIVLLVLVRIPLGEVGDRSIERVLLAEIRRDRDRVSRAGVRTRQRPTALRA